MNNNYFPEQEETKINFKNMHIIKKKEQKLLNE